MFFDSLPTELLQQIFGHCCSRYADINNVSKVCHRWEQVAQPFLLERTCLRVSTTYEPGLWRFTKAKMIDRSILLQSNRRYTCFRIEFNNTEDMQRLDELLDVCQERFPSIRRLFLMAPPNEALVHFFQKRQEWLQSLTHLNLCLDPAQSKDAGICEVSLPNLKELVWKEIGSYRMPELFKAWPMSHEALLEKSSDVLNGWHCFALTAPELTRLMVEMNCDLIRKNNMENRLQDPSDMCDLFLPTLALKPCPKLENVTIGGMMDFPQRHIDNCRRFLQHVKVLELFKCMGDATEEICEKCSNLKELTIQEPLGDSLPIQIAPALSPNLERLTIKNCPKQFRLFGPGVFPKLRSMSLTGQRSLGDIDLDAPQLTTFVVLLNEPKKVTLRHKQQITTMKVHVHNAIMDTVPPPPNVTDLHLRLPDNMLGLVGAYLAYFPNLQRLALYGEYKPYYYNVPALKALDCFFVERLPNLQYFLGHRLTLQLVDINKFAGLKSLILSECIIKAKPDDEEVPLTALEHFRVQRVIMDGIRIGENRFPIRANERRAPVAKVKRTYLGQGVFNSVDFQMSISDDFRIRRPRTAADPPSRWPDSD